MFRIMSFHLLAIVLLTFSPFYLVVLLKGSTQAPHAKRRYSSEVLGSGMKSKHWQLSFPEIKMIEENGRHF